MLTETEYSYLSISKQRYYVWECDIKDSSQWSNNTEVNLQYSISRIEKQKKIVCGYSSLYRFNFDYFFLQKNPNIIETLKLSTIFLHLT